VNFECGNGYFAKALSAHQEATQRSAFSAIAELLFSLVSDQMLFKPWSYVQDSCSTSSTVQEHKDASSCDTWTICEYV